MERCPNCNARIKGAVTCSRCKADLSLLDDIEFASKYFLATAIQAVSLGKTDQAVAALLAADAYKKNRLTEVLRNFLIEQQSRQIVSLLAEKKLLSAKQTLYSLRGLFCYSRQLEQLNGFADFLISNQTLGEEKLSS